MKHKDTKSQRVNKNQRETSFLLSIRAVCTAVSKALHCHPTSKLAAADELLSTALAGLALQKRKNRKKTLRRRLLSSYHSSSFSSGNIWWRSAGGR